MSTYWLFLDDIRDIARVYPTLAYKPWVTVRSAADFKSVILSRGMPQIISFDHDLSDEHYAAPVSDWENPNIIADNRTETGYDAAKWLTQYFNNTVKKHGHKIPQTFVHSMNPVGKLNIINHLNGWYREIDCDYICTDIKF